MKDYFSSGDNIIDTNYMYLFKWLEIFNTEKDTIKIKSLLVQSHTSHTDTRIKNFKTKVPVYS